MSRLNQDDPNTPGDYGAAPPRPAVRFEVPRNARLVPCKGCMMHIAFLPMPSGKKMPVEPNGDPHWTKCPASKEIRDRKRLEVRLAEIRAGKS